MRKRQEVMEALERLSENQRARDAARTFMEEFMRELGNPKWDYLEFDGAPDELRKSLDTVCYFLHYVRDGILCDWVRSADRWKDRDVE